MLVLTIVNIMHSLQELEEAQMTIESLKTSLRASETKCEKAVRTVRAAKTRLEELRADKDKVKTL